ncbi:MAG: hypothetical protein LUP95_04995 [Euryarchaeota archaeon]|nr:hypothetical protein [Euryarchaeota archaeon]
MKEVVCFDRLKGQETERACKRYSNNAHIRRAGTLEENLHSLLIVEGDMHNSRLLSKAILISQKKPNKRGRLTYKLSSQMNELLGVSGFIERSIPVRKVEGERHLKTLMNCLSQPKRTCRRPAPGAVSDLV